MLPIVMDVSVGYDCEPYKIYKLIKMYFGVWYLVGPGSPRGIGSLWGTLLWKAAFHQNSLASM